MRSAIAELRKRADSGWWVLLLIAIVVLTIAALMTELGIERWSRLAGAVAWATAFLGCVSALAAGVGRKANR